MKYVKLYNTSGFSVYINTERIESIENKSDGRGGDNAKVTTFSGRTYDIREHSMEIHKLLEAKP